MKNIFDIDKNIKIKNPSDLLELPIIIRVNEFDDKSAKEFSEQMSKAHNTGQPVIPITIDSFGGQAYSLLSMVADIRSSKIPVATICVGKAMSCGSVLLTFGAKGMRFADPESIIMFHDVFSINYGKNEEIKAMAKETDRLQKQIFSLVAENCGKKPDYFLKIMHDIDHAEWFITPKQAKRHNVIDHIGVPSFKTNISLDIKMEL